jgi:hypothetical protein
MYCSVATDCSSIEWKNVPGGTALIVGNKGQCTVFNEPLPGQFLIYIKYKENVPNIWFTCI